MVRKKGRIVVFNIGQAKEEASAGGYDLDFTYTPETSRPSHSSVWKVPHNPDESARVAAAIKRVITIEETYPALLPS